LTKDPCHAIGPVGLPSIETEEAVQKSNFRTNPGTARNHDLVEGPFSP
jgi:hypothetical protein